MKCLLIIVLFFVFIGGLFAQRKGLKTDIKTKWYAELDSYKDYNTIDTLILRKFDDLIKYSNVFYVFYDFQKKNIFTRTVLNNIPNGINDVSSATHEKWTIKNANDTLYCLTISNRELKTKIKYLVICNYKKFDVIDEMILVKKQKK